MGFHTYDVSRADALDDPDRYERLGAEELLDLFDPAGRLLDVGSGTGFYTDDVAQHADAVYGVDVQPAMHARYRENGVPSNVHLVTAEAGALPFVDAAFDRAFSTMTFHEFASPGACTELARVLSPSALVGIVDWDREGVGEAGPPTSERYALDDAEDMLVDAGFTVERSEARDETFLLRARL